MPQQISFAQAEYDAKRKTTRRDRFLGEMQRVVPWAMLLEVLAPYYYPQAGTGAGRPPIGLERMLRMYFLQQWFGLADEALEDAIYDSQAFRAFLGIDLGREAVPDATTLLRFRRLLEDNDLTGRIFETVKDLLRERGLLLEKGTLVDATIIAAPPSTKNKNKARDPDMHQTRKGKQYYFGAKAHIGADADSGLVHSVTATAANVADITETAHLLHGQETEVFADAGYVGAEKREELKDREIKWHIAAKRSTVTGMEEGALKDLTKTIEHLKAKIRARVEHPFHILKNLFGYRKVRYQGLKKNAAQFEVLFALVNLVIAKKALLA
jgi:IS5 family transposase